MPKLDTTDRFDTIKDHVRVEIPKIKGSRFIADAFPAPTEEEAKSRLAEIVANLPDATHHCHAFSVATGQIERSSDDGEPSGTAGPPILRRIHSSGLTNVLVVVTRYYGGTKLGAGGLIRAYGEAAKAVLGDCRRITNVIERILRVTFDYDDTSPAMRTIEKFGARLVSTDYADKSSLEIAVAASQVGDFKDAFRDALGNRGTVELTPVLTARLLAV